MAVEAILEHGHRASVANGRLQVVAEDQTVVDVEVADVEECSYTRTTRPDYPGLLLVKTKAGEEYRLHLFEADAPGFVAHLREPHGPKPSPRPIVQHADSTDES